MIEEHCHTILLRIMRNHYGIETKMYNQYAEQAMYHTKKSIHEHDYEMGLSPHRETGHLKADFNAQLSTLQYELEEAIDEHLDLLQQNKMLKEISGQQSSTDMELEKKNLETKNASLQEDVQKKRKEVMACERIIKILQAEMAQRQLEYKEW